MKNYGMYNKNNKDFIKAFDKLDEVFNYVKNYKLSGVYVVRYSNKDNSYTDNDIFMYL